MGYRLMVDLDVVDALDRLPAKVRTRLLVHFVEEPLPPPSRWPILPHAVDFRRESHPARNHRPNHRGE